MKEKTFSPSSEHFQSLASDRERLEFLVTLGIRASSPHNSQPWQFAIIDNSITIAHNLKYYLPIADPTKRELYMSLGTATANIELAASALGLIYSKKVTTDSESFPIIAIEFTSLRTNPVSDANDRLSAIYNRHNNRSPYTGGQIPPNFIATSQQIAKEGGSELICITDGVQIGKIQTLLGEAVKTAFLDKSFTSELANWVKPSFPWYKEGLPGYSMHVPWLLSLILPFMVRHKNISQIQQKIHEKYLNGVSAIGILTISEETPLQLESAGESFEQIAVYLEQNNIKTGVMQALIEVPGYRERLRSIALTPNLPILFFRLGYSSIRPKTSPRRPLNSFLIS